MRAFGIVLIVIGLVGLAIGGITYTRQETVLDAGPLEVRAEERRTIPIAPVAAGAAVLAGLVLVVLGARRSG